jgi:hypothetical protein
MKTLVMEHFNGIVFHKSELANKHHTNQEMLLNKGNKNDNCQGQKIILKNITLNKKPKH